MTLPMYLYNKILNSLNYITQKGVYAISFLVCANESNEFEGIKNFPEFLLGYNTEQDCNFADDYSEERWNCAFWAQEMIEIISTDDIESAQILLNWYNDMKIINLGSEDYDNAYDENMNYIGKGPVGCYELLDLVSNIAKQFQTNGVIKDKFGSIPIIVHDMEYSWYTKELTQNANPNNEANIFIKAFDKIFNTMQ